MDKFNNFFKTAADKLHLPDFFKDAPLIVNNFFLAIVALVLLIALILVICLVPGKKKAQKAAEKSDAVAEDSISDATEEVAAPVETAPVEKKEELVAEKKAPVIEKKEEPAPVKEEAPAPIAEEKVAPAPVKEEASAPAEKKEEPAAEKKAPVKKAAPAKEVAATTDSDKKAEEDPVRNGGKYEIVRRKGSYYFLLKANNGQLLLESSSYTSEAGAKKAIETFKNAVEVGEFNIDEDKNGNFKFILRASARSQMLYRGESYGTRQSAENAIQSVKNFAFKSVVKRVEENDDDDGADAASVLALAPLKPADHKLGGKYEIIEREGSYYFLLKANNGQLLVESPAFTTEQGAKSGIDTFKKAAATGIFMIDSDKNGNFKFILRASTRSQLRYCGESYSTRQSAENSVNSVRCFAQNAVLK